MGRALKLELYITLDPLDICMDALYIGDGGEAEVSLLRKQSIYGVEAGSPMKYAK